jgi:hypothetical protein
LFTVSFERSGVKSERRLVRIQPTGKTKTTCERENARNGRVVRRLVLGEELTLRGFAERIWETDFTLADPSLSLSEDLPREFRETGGMLAYLEVVWIIVRQHINGQRNRRMMVSIQPHPFAVNYDIHMVG